MKYWTFVGQYVRYFSRILCRPGLFLRIKIMVGGLACRGKHCILHHAVIFIQKLKGGHAE